MSSRLSAPTLPATRPVPAVPKRTVTAASDPTSQPFDEREFASFAWAIGKGVALGVPLLAVLITAVVRLAVPEWGLGAAIGVASWVAAWTGVFLGGTFTVGLWSSRHH